MTAKWAGYNPTQFFDLDGEEQSIMVAAYRVSMQVDAVLNNEQRKTSERMARKKPGKRRH